MPAHNEGERIEATVAAILETGRIGKVTVVDDGSTDQTAAKARAAGAEVVSLPRRLGKAAAVAAGLRALEAQICLLLDADLEASARHAPELIKPIEAGVADLVIARLPPAGRRAGFGLARGLARWGVRRLAGVELESPLSGQRAFRRSALQAFRPAMGFGLEVAWTLDAAAAGLRIVEVAVPFQHRETGRDLSGFLHRGRQFAAVAYALWQRGLGRV